MQSRKLPKMLTCLCTALLYGASASPVRRAERTFILYRKERSQTWYQPWPNNMIDTKVPLVEVPMAKRQREKDLKVLSKQKATDNSPICKERAWICLQDPTCEQIYTTKILGKYNRDDGIG